MNREYRLYILYIYVLYMCSNCMVYSQIGGQFLFVLGTQKIRILYSTGVRVDETHVYVCTYICPYIKYKWFHYSIHLCVYFSRSGQFWERCIENFHLKKSTYLILSLKFLILYIIWLASILFECSFLFYLYKLCLTLLYNFL